jgi:hypothetical protein
MHRDLSTMVRLEPGQRRLLVTHLTAVANLVVGSLLLGQFVGSRPFSIAQTAGALVLWAVLLGVAFMLAAGE